MPCCKFTGAENSEIFIPLNRRKCTDLICLAIFVVYMCGMVVIGAVGVIYGDLNYILYPRDYLGQYCGNSDYPGVANRKKAAFPRLDADLAEQRSLFFGPAGIFLFQPYTVCQDECPAAFSLSNPEQLGGPSYPGAASDAPSYYNYAPTRELWGRCLPIIDNQPGLDRQICGTPHCGSDELVACLGYNISCTSIDSNTDVTNAWEVDMTNATQVACCSFRVHEVNTQTFLPPDSTGETRSLEDQFAKYVTSAFGVIRAISESWQTIVGLGLVAPFAFAFGWFSLLFLFAGVLIAFALVLTFVALIVVTTYLYYKAGYLNELPVDLAQLTGNFTTLSIVPVDNSDVSQVMYTVLAVCSTVATLLYVIFILMARQAINRCIAIVREVTRLLFALPFMTLWPLLGVLVYVALLAYALFIGMYIITSHTNSFMQIAAALNRTAHGDTLNTAADTLDSALGSANRETQVAIMFSVHAVGCLWLMFITEGTMYTTLARSAAVWYFSHELDPGSGEVIQKGAFRSGIGVVIASAWCVFTRHLGSICFGAAILTIMFVLRALMTAIERYMKDASGTNALLRLVLKCAKCCLWCLERTVKFITFYGYIFVAIEGSSFCRACLTTFGFIVKYPKQMAVNRIVATILSCVISLSIPLAAAGIGFIFTDQHNPARPGPFWVALVIFILAFVIASAITDVFKCCIDTVFVCAFKDMEEHSPPKFMTQTLRSGFGLDDVKPAEYAPAKLDESSEYGRPVKPGKGDGSLLPEGTQLSTSPGTHNAEAVARARAASKQPTGVNAKI